MGQTDGRIFSDAKARTLCSSDRTRKPGSTLPLKDNICCDLVSNEEDVDPVFGRVLQAWICRHTHANLSLLADPIKGRQGRVAIKQANVGPEILHREDSADRLATHCQFLRTTTPFLVLMVTYPTPALHMAFNGWYAEFARAYAPSHKVGAVQACLVRRHHCRCCHTAFTSPHPSLRAAVQTGELQRHQGAQRPRDPQLYPCPQQLLGPNKG